MSGTTLAPNTPPASPADGTFDRAGMSKWRMTSWRSRGPVRTLLDLSGLLLLTLALGARVNAFTGFPEGNDVWGHLSKTRFVLDNWPDVSWNYEWYSGMPTFLGSYPPGYHMLVAAIATIGHVQATTAMNVAALAGILGVVIGVYGTVRGACGSRAAALVAGVALLGTPTLWAQAVTYGLYPRLLGLAAVALALSGATRVAVRGCRLTMIGTSVALAVALSMHPVVGMAGVALVAGMLLVGSWRAMPHRGAAVAAVAALTGGLSAYFYLPLMLLPRAQSPWTDQEDPLTAAMLIWAPRTQLAGLSPVLLPVAAAAVAVAVVRLRRPHVPLADKIALGTDITFLGRGSGASLPHRASPRVRDFADWRTRMVETGFSLRAMLVLSAGVPVVLGYGFVGYLAPRFPYYVNGLQPVDLLVYPAWLLACVVGIGLGLVLRRRPGWAHRRLRAPLVTAMAVLTIAGLLGTAASLPAGAQPNGSRQDRARAAGLPSDSPDHQYRLAVVDDPTSSFVNAVSRLPQTRGYQDHGNLQQDYQVWFEQALMGHHDQSSEVRHFLLDWNAVGTVMSDPASAPLAWERADPRLTEAPASRSPYATFSVPGAGPVISASRAPTVLVIGDQEHYDLVLRALAQADVDSRSLVPVQGPAVLADVTLTELVPFDAVLLYGGDLGPAGKAAAALHRYASRGGRVVVAGADRDGPARSLLRADRGLMPVSSLSRRTVRASWEWTASGDAALTDVDLDAFGPPSYAGSGLWDVEAGQLAKEGRPVLRSGGSLVTATRRLGRGSVTWEGFALPYHAADSGSAAEGRLLGNLLGATSTRPLPARVQFVNSERRTVVVGRRTRGVLVKEHLAPDWHATSAGHELTLRTAGPGMMWVQLPARHGRMRIVLDYRLGGVERAGLAVSAVALLVLMALIGAAAIGRRRRRSAPGR
jgi:hypothetical protein